MNDENKPFDGKSLEETINDIKNSIREAEGEEVIINESPDHTKDPNDDFSEYRMNADKEKMFNPEENVVNYGGLLDQMFGSTVSGVIQDDDKINVSDNTKSKISDILGDLDDDDDDDWMNE